MPAFTVKSVPFGQDRPKVTISVMQTDPHACAEQARKAIQMGVEVIEWRADYAYDAHTPADIHAFISEFGHVLSKVCRFTPLIATLRTNNEGGSTELSDDDYTRFEKEAIESGFFDFIDIEARIGDASARDLCEKARANHVRSIVSMHIFEGTPSVSSMVKKVTHMHEMGADMPKLAVMAYGPRDAVDVLTASTDASNKVGICPLVLMAMDASGTITRVAGQQFGSALAFASLDAPSAPGQLSVRPTQQLVSLLSPAHAIPESRQKPISGTTHMVFLLGNPVEHSLSPAIHNASFARSGIDAKYLAFRIPSDDIADAQHNVAQLINSWKHVEGIDGCNVTMPYKNVVAECVDELSSTARMTGACNVVAFENGQAKGYNTDGAGLVIALGFHHIRVAHAHMTILGTGGAASAIVAECAQKGADHLYVGAHSAAGAKKMQKVIDRIHEQIPTPIDVFDIADTKRLAACLHDSKVLVNATNVGMGDAHDPYAHMDKSPIPSDVLPKDIFVMDAIYYPRETKLVQDAHAQGIPAYGGIEMLVAQAAESERIWYHCRMNILATMQHLG